MPTPDLLALLTAPRPCPVDINPLSIPIRRTDSGLCIPVPIIVSPTEEDNRAR